MIQVAQKSSLTPKQAHDIVHQLIHRAEDVLVEPDKSNRAYVHESEYFSRRFPGLDYFGRPQLVVECKAQCHIMAALAERGQTLRVISPSDGVVKINAYDKEVVGTVVVSPFEGREACRVYLGGYHPKIMSRSFGTMVAVYPMDHCMGGLPIFGSAIAAGIFDQAVGIRSKIWRWGDGMRSRAPLMGDPIVLVDESKRSGSTFWQQKLEGAQIPFQDLGSAFARHQAVIDGRVSASLEWTEDANIPLAVTLPLLRSAGGDIFTIGDGKIPELRGIGAETYQEFHFLSKKSPSLVTGVPEPPAPIVVARTRADAEALLARLFG